MSLLLLVTPAVLFAMLLALSFFSGERRKNDYRSQPLDALRRYSHNPPWHRPGESPSVSYHKYRGFKYRWDPQQGRWIKEWPARGFFLALTILLAVLAVWLFW